MLLLSSTLLTDFVYTFIINYCLSITTDDITILCNNTIFSKHNNVGHLYDFLAYKN